jgi:hypothetical protein
MKDTEETIKIKINKMKVLEEDIKEYFGEQSPSEQDLINLTRVGILQIREYAYRRGASHGFSVGRKEMTLEEENRIKEKILAWRSDLTIMGGIPGSSGELTEMGKT